MLDRIAQFIRTFFRLIFEDLRKLFLPKNREPVVVKEPDPEDLEPQDGAEVSKDTIVVVDTNLEEIIISNPSESSESDLPEDPSGEQPSPDSQPGETTDPQPEAGTPDKPEEDHKPRYLWCLDNGHGKLTAGKRSPKLRDETFFYEYEFNRIIVKGIIKELKKLGIQYYNVVPEVNVDNFLKGRVLRANNKHSDIPKIFLSIHSNAGPGRWTSAQGLETWFYHGSRKGKKLAAVFQQELVNTLGWLNRGIKSQQSNQFYVLSRTNMPAILTENGFFNNRKEVYLLKDEEIQKKIIQAHVDAIQYFEKNGI